MGNILSSPRPNKSVQAKYRDMRDTIARRTEEMKSFSCDEQAHRSTLTDADLDAMTFQDLGALRCRVTSAQNLKNPLLALPAELRNRIWHLAFTADLKDQIVDLDFWSELELTNGKRSANPQPVLHPPSFLNACRQMKDEAGGILYGDIMIWEEYDHQKQKWEKIKPKDITSLFHARSDNGKELFIDRNFSSKPGGLVVSIHNTKIHDFGWRLGIIRLGEGLGRRVLSWNVGRGASNVELWRSSYC